MSEIASNLDDVLGADPRDPGCDATLQVLDLYVESDLAGLDPVRRFPGPAAHLRSCPACREDYEGLRRRSRRFRPTGTPERGTEVQR